MTHAGESEGDLGSANPVQGTKLGTRKVIVARIRMLGFGEAMFAVSIRTFPYSQCLIQLLQVNKSD